ncbi:glycoside hydrolase family 95 protein [Pseudoduganella umbonata]|uniref:Alpha-L-fucosidase 2 n=1 Tax=Pseudoduganella umbonata TaxID=864828 RepID=A0A4P8I027_9BURK|nr:glycoside hydrolase family 95 protein [Pseudoduganella umbonata]MBB3224000.1 alpha-L-fucosidase 2 [Pseudoduganella umbonata]QCP14124.1 glycoside hydrolase family 95 protein [Pseudoduganella umbonata]
MTVRFAVALPIAFLSAALLAATAGAAPADALTLHYDRPAEAWTEALPVGNGRLGAMVFGRPGEELLQLNEATLWSGGPVGGNLNPGAFDALGKARAALAGGDYAGGSDWARRMQGPYTESYQPLGDLLIRQDLKGTATGYRRALDIRDGIATTSFTVDGVRYGREVFASAPDGVIVVRLTSSAPRRLDLDVAATSQLRARTAATGTALVMAGRAPAHVDPNYVNYNPEPVVWADPSGCRGMRFELIVQPVVTDGTVEASGERIAIRGASEVVLLLSAATSFAGFDKCPDSAGRDQHALALAHLEKAAKRDYTTLRAAHVAEFRRLFDRMALTLNPGETDRTALPTDRRLAEFTAGQPDAALEALYVQFGRYLLISSSRTRGAPANLQGIWSDAVRPPWSSNYTTNINVQMNYWPVESANLSELFTPMDDLIRHLAVTGADTAASYYRAPGWAVHHNSDIWAASNPVGDFGKGDPKWANWSMGSAWLSRHLWEHYQYTGDTAYLREVYPLMKEAARFTLAWLHPDADGHLVTSPSTSPENDFYYGDGRKGTVSVGATMDLAIARDLFENVGAAAQVLGIDGAFRAELESATARLLPFRVGARGQLQEWYKDFDEVEPHHRHVSHLYALHPARTISPLATPGLAAAARRTLELRGDDGTGWALAWKVNFWARLLDGDRAHRLFRNLLRLTKPGDKHGGAYANLFDAHPPFQIDGNFAGTAGAIEMLLQSQNGELHLLPALPAAWRDGAVKGIVGRGNYVVDIDWHGGRLRGARIEARQGGQCVVRTAVPVEVDGVRSRPGAIGHTVTFRAVKGKTYAVRPI